MNNIATVFAHMSEGTYATNSANSGDINGANLAMVIGGVIFVLLLILVPYIIGAWKTYRKAAQPGWAALIPVYDTVVQCRIAKINPWWAVLALVPVVDNILTAVQVTSRLNHGQTFQSATEVTGLASVNLDFALITGVLSFSLLGLFLVLSGRIARNFGRGLGMTLLLFFLPFIGYPILGFGAAKYKPLKAAKKSPAKRAA